MPTAIGGRPAVLEQSRYAIEAAPGSGVKAVNRLRALMIEPTAQEPLSDVLASGYKVPVGSVSENGRHTQATLKGKAAINDLIWAFAHRLGRPTVTTPSGATATKRFRFLGLSNQALDLPSSTIDNGYSGGLGSRFCHAAIPSLQISFGEKEIAVSGSMVGQQLAETGVTLEIESNVVDIVLVPLDAGNWSAYIGDTLSTVSSDANNQLLRCFETNIGLNDGFEPYFVGNAAIKSFPNNGLVEKPNNNQGGINIERNAQGLTQMNALQGKTKLYHRIIATGPLIETNFNYKLQITYAFQFRQPKPGETQNAKAYEFDTRLIHDATLGGYIEVIIDTAATQTQLLGNGTALGAGQSPNELDTSAFATPVMP